MSVGLLKASTKMLAKNSGKIIGGGFAAYSAVDGYNTARQEGNGVVSSAVSGLAEAALPLLMGGWGYAAYVAATELPALTVNALEAYSQYGRNLARQSKQTPFMNAKFNETQQTYTMRQAGMQLAQRSKYNLQQSMLGDEARYMHR